MANSLVPGIRKAIQSDKSILYDTKAEKEKIVPILRQLRFINVGNINLIESQYNDKISKLQDRIIAMGKHLIELEGGANE